MVRTRVGYAGGSRENPTYRSLGDHAETIQIDYDPALISYEELLAVFWASHSPVARPWSSQYASIIFYHNPEQKRLAEESRDREQERLGQPIFTEMAAYDRFYRAEDYHQKYRLRAEPRLLAELEALYPAPADLVDSTLAARLNGFLDGRGSLADVEAEIDSLDLAPEVRARLLEILATRR